MSKNIVIFSDGTGQEGGKGYNTNVYKLFNMIEDRSLDQIAFYDRGLGTGWRKVTGSTSGAGISKNIKESYEFLFENYQSRDRVYLFGFSRGAYTVRSLSGFVDMFGILPKSRHELIDEAYKIYKIEDKVKREEQRKNFLGRHHTMRCPIRFIGVWDTVGALGLPYKTLDLLNPFKHDFHSTGMCMNIEVGRHALALDEERKVFEPVYWDESKAGHTPDEIRQDIMQVWFSGVHTDIGVGYREAQLSDISLTWMQKEAAAAGLRIYKNHKVKVIPDLDGKMHDSREGIGQLYRKEQRSLKKFVGKTVVHQSVLDRANSANNKYEPWILVHSPEVEF